MNISTGLLLKILGASTAVGGVSVGTWFLMGGDGQTEWDKKLIEKIEGMDTTTTSSITQATESSEPKTTNYTIGGANNSNKLVITTKKETNSNIFEFKISENSGNTTQEIHNKMKHWECKFNGTGLEAEITKLKESFGIKTDVTQTKKEHKESMVKFISSCAYYGKPWKPSELNAKDQESDTENNKLSRTVEIKNSEEIKKFYKSETPS